MVETGRQRADPEAKQRLQIQVRRAVGRHVATIRPALTRMADAWGSITNQLYGSDPNENAKMVYTSAGVALERLGDEVARQIAADPTGAPGAFDLSDWRERDLPNMRASFQKYADDPNPELRAAGQQGVMAVRYLEAQTTDEKLIEAIRGEQNGQQ